MGSARGRTKPTEMSNKPEQKRTVCLRDSHCHWDSHWSSKCWIEKDLLNELIVANGRTSMSLFRQYLLFWALFFMCKKGRVLSGQNQAKMGLQSAALQIDCAMVVEASSMVEASSIMPFLQIWWSQTTAPPFCFQKNQSLFESGEGWRRTSSHSTQAGVFEGGGVPRTGREKVLKRCTCELGHDTTCNSKPMHLFEEI